MGVVPRQDPLVAVVCEEGLFPLINTIALRVEAQPGLGKFTVTVTWSSSARGSELDERRVTSYAAIAATTKVVRGLAHRIRGRGRGRWIKAPRKARSNTRSCWHPPQALEAAGARKPRATLSHQIGIYRYR